MRIPSEESATLDRRTMLLSHNSHSSSFLLNIIFVLDDNLNPCSNLDTDTMLSVAESLDSPEDLITMDNGCVCCSVRGDLVRTLGQLAKRRKDFDAILLETTGLADPAPVVYTGKFNVKSSDTLNAYLILDTCVYS